MTRSAHDPRLFFCASPRQPGRYAISFLGLPPPNPDDSPTVLGWTRVAAGRAAPPPKDAPINPSTFDENPRFLELVHATLRQFAGESTLLSSMAVARGSGGYLHISGTHRPPSEGSRSLMRAQTNAMHRR
jgi:hypothetical protein